MKCMHCNSEWNVNPSMSATMKNCPLCGKPLVREPKKADTLETALIEIRDCYGTDALRNYLVAYFKDLAPSLKKEIQMLDYFVECDGNRLILDALSKHTAEQNLCVERVIMKLSDEKLMDKTMAETVCRTFYAVVSGTPLKTVPVKTEPVVQNPPVDNQPVSAPNTATGQGTSKQTNDKQDTPEHEADAPVGPPSEHTSVPNPGRSDPKKTAGPRIFLFCIIAIIAIFLFSVLGKSGWEQQSNGTYRYYKFGQCVTGWQTIDGNEYYFRSSDGAMLTGFQTIDGEEFYFGESDGAMQTGWQTINNNKFYFGMNGVMQTGWQTIDGKRYYFEPNRVVQTIRNNGHLYSIYANGHALTGWQTIDDNTYYFDENGVMQTGRIELYGTTYYFDPQTGALIQ